MRRLQSKQSVVSLRAVLAGTIRVLSVIILAGILTTATAEFPDGSIKAYVSHTQMVIVTKDSDRWTTGQLTLCRLDGSIFVLPSLTLSGGGRMRLFYGELYEPLLAVGYDRIVSRDDGYADLTSNLWKNRSALLNSAADRLFADYTHGDWQVRLGRHRINWGKTLVWNPNDIFNAFSGFDPLYVEGPGTDALLVRRYLGAASQVEAVWAKNAVSNDSSTVAALAQVNIYGFDVQALTGWMRHDVVIGTGFSGQAGGAALRGELSLFNNEHFSDDLQTVASLSADYTFPHEIWVQAAILYNSSGKQSPSDGFASLLNERITARHLSDAMWQCYLQATWQITPLWSIDMSSIVNPVDGSFLLMPLTTVSLAENLEVKFQAQVQAGERQDQFGGKENAVYGSVQMNF